MTVRVCPKRDAECPHGISCPYTIDRYDCADEPKQPLDQEGGDASYYRTHSPSPPAYEDAPGDPTPSGAVWPDEAVLNQAIAAFDQATRVSKYEDQAGWLGRGLSAALLAAGPLPDSRLALAVKGLKKIDAERWATPQYIRQIARETLAKLKDANP